MEKTAVTCVAWLPKGRCSGRLANPEEPEDGEAEADLRLVKNSVPGLEDCK